MKKIRREVGVSDIVNAVVVVNAIVAVVVIIVVVDIVVVAVYFSILLRK